MRTTDTTWDDANGHTWNIQFVEEDETLISVTVTSTTGGPLPLTTLTRVIPYGDLLDKIRQERYTRKIPDGTTWDGVTGREWVVHGDGLTVHESPPPRRRTMNRELMEKVADVYTAAAGLKNPTQKVQDHFMVSYPTAARWVSQARRDPWNTLPPTTKGKPT